MVLSAITNYNIPFLSSGILDTIFHKTFLIVAILGQPPNGYRLTLIGLLIIFVIAITANFVTEYLTGKKIGKLFGATVVTIIGASLFQAYVNFPFDFALENVRILAALLGSIFIAVFYVLIRGKGSGGK